MRICQQRPLLDAQVSQVIKWSWNNTFQLISTSSSQCAVPLHSVSVADPWLHQMKFCLFDVSYPAFAETTHRSCSSANRLAITLRIVGPAMWLYCVHLLTAVSSVWGQFIWRAKCSYEGWNFNFGNTPLDWIQELLEWRANAAGRLGPSPTYIHNGSGPSRNGHTQ